MREVSRLTRRRVTATLAQAAGLGLLAAGCGQSVPPPAPAAGGLKGTFELLGHDSAVLVATIEGAVRSFAAKAPEAQVVFTSIKQAEVATKIRSAIAAGSGPAGFYHQAEWWRGVDAASITQPLTPRLFSRAELEQMTFSNLWGALWTKGPEVHFIPYAVGLNATMLLYNVDLLGNAGIDPKGLTTLEAMLAAATRLTVKAGTGFDRAGMLLTYPTNLIQNWILDQGGSFYDEKTKQWTWQTAAAERAFQWVLDVYDKHGVGWRDRDAPPESRNPLGEARTASVLGQGAFAISSYVKSHPDTKLADLPLPSFAPGKAAHYYIPSVAGLSLSALVKPDDPAARIGAAFYRHLYTMDSATAFANEYSGGILVKGLYADPRFRSTAFGAIRSGLPEQVISKSLTLSNAADPGFATHVTRVVNGELSIKAALADMQQQYSAAESDLQRGRQ
jgi:multiple sugar transport system substrate-binding protein